MATISPVQLALRDLGQGIGGVLERDAERKRLALQEQQQQNQLSLQQAQLANQARLDEGKLGVSLAEVGLRGRQFEQQQALRERELTGQEQARRDLAAYHTGTLGIQQQQVDVSKAQQRDTARYQQRELTGQEQARRDLAAYHTGTLGIQQQQVDVSKAQQRDTARYQQGTLAQQQAQLRAMAPVYQAQAEDITQQARVRRSQANEMERSIAEGNQGVNPLEVLKGFHALWSSAGGKDYADTLTSFAQSYLTATHPALDVVPKGPQGEPLYPQRDVAKVIDQIQPLAQAYLQHKLKTAIPLDQQIKIVTETFSKQSDAKQAQGLSAYMMEVLPMFKNLEGYNAALKSLEDVIEGPQGIRATETAAYRQERKLSPTAPLPKAGLEAIQKAVDVARAAGQRQIQSQILGEQDMAAVLNSLKQRAGGPTQATETAPGATGTPGPSLAAATQASAAIGTPEWLVTRYRQGDLSQDLVLQTLQQRHGINERQALAVMYPTPESAITDAVRGRKTPPLDAPTIKSAVQTGKIGRQAGERLLQTTFGLSLEQARAFLTQP